MYNMCSKKPVYYDTSQSSNSHSKLWRLPGDDSGVWPGNGTVGKNQGRQGRFPGTSKL